MSNATGVIESGTSVGNYLNAHGDRRFANVAWRAAIRAYDRRYVLRDARERRVVALFSAHSYREAFDVYAPWLRPLEMRNKPRLSVASLRLRRGAGKRGKLA